VTVARHGTSVALVEPTPHYFDALKKIMPEKYWIYL
jgi:hypothetical protein